MSKKTAEKSPKKPVEKMAKKANFTTLYPYLTWWIASFGTIEIAPDGIDALIFLHDAGGDIWDSGDIDDLDRAFDEAENFVRHYLVEELGEEPL